MTVNELDYKNHEHVREAIADNDSDRLYFLANQAQVGGDYKVAERLVRIAHKIKHAP